MKGKVIKKLITFIVRLDDGRTGKTNIIPNFENSVNWVDIEQGDRVRDLKWKSEKDGIIDGDSPVERE